ncbi:4Fe-4S dicluster domain-containing protein [Helicobacter equorum]|uniref:4Fe-4S dicluster domain-containing protein n=1 Tax=Helicobacter equorum TaxID=361872 RepID=UPI000CF0150C|nr:4Fe-4S dicluster domain-containing protein [Helicobacter equorum]
MPILPQYNDCCGCSACYAACPHNSIAMDPDIEGFLYPYVNVDTCTECKACEVVCPTLPFLDFAPYNAVKKTSKFPYNTKLSCAQTIDQALLSQVHFIPPPLLQIFV